ncbi:MAG: SIMPL domain-containing protein [Stenotrophomonas sp.]
MRLLPSSLCLGLLLALPTASTFAQSLAPVPVAADATVLTINASAQASAVPDVAMINAGVLTQDKDSNLAMRRNAEQMQQVMAALKAAGIAERDIQTSGISLNPQYHYAENQPPQLQGYQASNGVNIKVRELGGLGRVLDALAAQGANQINGPSFAIDQPEPLYQQARLEALRKARQQADTYARELGLKVRRVISLQESGGGGMPVPMMAMRNAAKMEMDTPVAAGQSSIQVQLDVVFELGR